MTKFLLYLVWLILSIIVVIVLGVFVALTVFDKEIEDILVAKIEQNTGRDVSIQGGFGFYFRPSPTFYAKDIKMANAEWGSQPWMLEIDSIEANFSFEYLLQGKAILTHAKIVRPRMLIEQDALGQHINWSFDSNQEPKIFKRVAEHLQIKTASIDDAQIQLNVGPVRHTIEVKAINGRTDPVTKAILAHATGRIHGKEVIIEASFENLRHILLREPTKLQFSGQYGETDFNGQGQVKDIMRWQGHKIGLELSTPSLDSLQAWIDSPLIQTPPLTANAEFIQSKMWQTARLDNIRIVNQSLDGEAIITGHVAQLKDFSGIDLKGKASYPIAKIMQWKGLESNTDAQIDTQFRVYGNKQSQLSLAVDSASVTGEGLLVSGEGEIPHILFDDTPGIPLTFEAESLSTLGNINDKLWQKTKKINGQFLLRKKSGKLAIDEAQVFAFDKKLGITGALDDIVEARVGEFEILGNLNARDIDTFNKLNKTQLPTFEKTNIKGSIRSSKNLFFVPKMSASLQSNGVSVTLNGEIQDLSLLKLAGASLALQAQSVQQINQVFGSSLPELGTVSATGSLSGDLDNVYNIKDIKAKVDGKYQSIKATGKVTDLGERLTAAFQLKADIFGHENLAQFLETDQTLSGNLTGHGEAKLTATGINDWSAKQIRIDLDGETQGLVSGQISHFPAATDIALTFDLSEISLESLPSHEVLDELNVRSAQFSGELTKPSAQTNYALQKIKARLLLDESNNGILVSGSINDVATFKGMNLDVEVDIKELATLPYLGDIPFKKNITGVGAFELVGNSSDAKLTINQLNILDSDLQGELEFVQQGETTPKIKTQLTAKNLNILSLIKDDKRKRLFSKDPLALSWLHNYDVDFQLNAERLNGLISQLSQAQARITIKNGILQMPNLNGDVGDGRLSIWLTIIPLEKGYNIINAIKGERIKPKHINLFGDSGLMRDGFVEVDVGLAGKGNSLAEFMDNASGKILLGLDQVALKNENIELFGADLITGVLNIVNPFKKKADYLNIECGVIHFPVLNGKAIASQGVAIKTDKVTVLGGGIINLGPEELNILIKPKARKGLGFSAGTLANIAKISGTFSEPNISVDAGSVVQSALSIGAAIASSGLTLLAQGLLDRTKANSDVCQQTRLTPDDLKISLFQQKHKQPKDTDELIESQNDSK